MRLKVKRSHEGLPEHLRSLLQGSGFSDGQSFYIERRDGESAEDFEERLQQELVFAKELEASESGYATTTGYEWGADPKGEQAEAISQMLHGFERAYQESEDPELVKREFISRLSRHAGGLDRKLQKSWRKRARRYSELVDGIDYAVRHQYSMRLATEASDGQGSGSGKGSGESETPYDAPAASAEDSGWQDQWEREKESAPAPKIKRRKVEKAEQMMRELDEKESRPLEYQKFDPNDNPFQEKKLEFAYPKCSEDFEEYLERRTRLLPLIGRTTRELEQLIPRAYRQVGRSEQGDEIDLEAAVDFMADVRSGILPSPDVYVDERRNVRDVYVGLLLDLSGSMAGNKIERLKDATTILSESMESIGDQFSIVGFSGQCPVVEMYVLKDVQEDFNRTVRARIGAIHERNQNRDGAAVRWMTDYMARTPHKTNILLMVSDGQPWDHEYPGSVGDTKDALQQARARGLHPRVITVDSAAEHYLADMYTPGHYRICTSADKLPDAIQAFYRQIAT